MPGGYSKPLEMSGDFFYTTFTCKKIIQSIELDRNTVYRVRCGLIC